MTDPWTLYWRSNHLQSCVPTAGNAQVAALDAYWQAFADTLAPAARVLDLATGNGVVPLQLLGRRADLRITGVDRAEIDPQRMLAEPGPLRAVRFLGGVDLADAERCIDLFDAVTSQFGVEYLPAAAAASAVARHLRPGGSFCLLVHHAGSAIVVPRAAELEELDRLLAPEGPAGAAAQLADGLLDAAGLEALTHDYMRADLRRTRRLSGQVVAGVERTLSQLEAGAAAESRAFAVAMVERVAAERERLRQLRRAALDDAAATAFRALLEDAGLRCDVPDLVTSAAGASSSVASTDADGADGLAADSALVLGWRFAGMRPD